MFIVTLVGTPELSSQDVLAASEILASRDHIWIDSGQAADIEVSALAPDGVARIEAALPHVDVFAQPASARHRRLFVADMDSTMIQAECIDELADFAGKKAEIAAVTEAAMRGELDFEAALRGRVEALEGLEVSAIRNCLDTRISYTPGAKTLIATLKAEGIRTCLVSGGFHSFADPVGEGLGFDVILANRLETAAGRLTGVVGSPIVDSAAKKALLLAESEGLGVGAGQAIAIGDGANDLDMVKAAGLGVAYHAKPKLAEAADARIRSGDLTVLLYALGLEKSRWQGA
ncbi:phosphoserine phosphatase SerB [Pacificimonas flava]|uniref:Phosphoserine phosphatase n=2 Tax=Pacificimonas TaxID=1960290 RepID=A0A219B827_9SPHN|nr:MULTISPECIES: phosphoserine phosphatase SerB [Pacificimonas]MBZ6378382.1 phosphoserine phosphatase SerB [Pacificimonas aurantium]OWV34313.1 phosphoserine phosphatase SerB [Pacificimonas flava]